MEKESKTIHLGTSKLVPNVQELAKQSMVALPSRYIRTDQESSTIISDPNLAPTLPVIDMQKLLGGDDMKAELSKLDSACKEWGFFQLVNHGVNIALLERTKQELKQLFNLTIEEKKRFWQQENEVEGFGQAFIVSDEQKLDWGDIFFLTTLPTHARKPHLFPKLPSTLRKALDDYSLELKHLAMKILGVMEKNLNMKMNDITSLFEDGTQSMRMNYYPPCPQPEKAIGITPHSDSVGLTILLQVNEIEGLQVRKEGMWIPVKPLPNAFIVNVGDILEIVTNGIYRSIEHRAIVNQVKERISIATFYSPRYEEEIAPASSLVTTHTPAVFKSILVEDYFKGLFNRKLGGKSYLELMKI